MTATFSSPLMAAVRSNDATAVRAALAELPTSAPWPRDADGHTPLHWAAMAESGNLLAQLLSAANASRPVDARSAATLQEGQTPLHWACVAGHVGAVRALLARGADPAAVDAKGYSAATHAVHYGRVDLLHLLLVTCPALVAMPDWEGHTLLQWAAYYDHHPAVAYLLAVWHVDPDVADKTGMTSLHRAAQRDTPIIAEALLRAGADVAARNGSGKVPAELVPEGGRTTYLLKVWGKGLLTRRQPVPSRHKLQKYGLVIFYYVLVVVSYFKYYALLAAGTSLGIRGDVVLHVALLVSMASHLLATFADPGDIPKGNADTLVAYVEQVLSDGTSEAALVPSAYCFTCLAPRPPRSKHSRERDCCVKVFDHECPWVNNTVGLYTHKPLLLLVLSTAILEWLFIYSMILVLVKSPDVSSVFTAVVEEPLICVLVLVNGVVSMFCIMLFLTHVRLVLRGQTTYEHLAATRDKLTTNPYDMGMWRNLVSFLTSTGPGTGKSMMPLSVATLHEVVMATGDENVKQNAHLTTFETVRRTTTNSAERKLPNPK